MYCLFCTDLYCTALHSATVNCNTLTHQFSRHSKLHCTCYENLQNKPLVKYSGSVSLFPFTKRRKKRLDLVQPWEDFAHTPDLCLAFGLEREGNIPPPLSVTQDLSRYIAGVSLTETNTSGGEVLGEERLEEDWGSSFQGVFVRSVVPCWEKIPVFLDNNNRFVAMKKLRKIFFNRVMIYPSNFANIFLQIKRFKLFFLEENHW